MNKDIRKSLISLGIIVNILTLAGCGKTVDCEVEGNHIHKYISDYGIERYIIGESESTYSFSNNTYYRTDDYIELDEETKKVYDTINRYSLINIKDNESVLYNLSDSLKDYYEFEYYYYKTEYHTHTITDADGNQTTYTTTEEVKKYDWTTNPHHSNLTGDKRIITHVFYGYNVVKGKNGKYTVIKGGPVDDIRLLVEMGYKYIDNDLYSSMNRRSYLESVGLYGHISESDLKTAYIIDHGNYIPYDEYVLSR